MKQVKIANFKSHLSSYLKQVKGGSEVVILDRDRPIAKVIPIREKREKIKVRKAKIKGGFKNWKFTGIKARVDVVKLLREDRDKR